MAQICPLCPAVLRCLTRAHPENRGGATIWRQLLCGSLGVEPDGWDGAFALPTALRAAGLVAGGQVTCAIKYVVVIFAEYITEWNPNKTTDDFFWPSSLCSWLVALIAACLGPGMADYAVAKCYIFTQFSN